MNITPDKACRGCDYLAASGTCDYLLIVGKRRPCAAGTGCTVFAKGGKGMNTSRWDTVRAEALREAGKTAIEIAETLGTTPAAVRGYFQRQARGGATSMGAPRKDAPLAPPKPEPAETAPRMSASELAGLLCGLADRYPTAEISFEGTPISSVDLSVSFAATGAAARIMLG